MIISGSSWGNYIKRLRKVNDAAADKMTEYLQTHEVVTQGERKQMLDYAYGLATHYGEGAAELACQMYDAAAEAQGANVPPAEPAETATYGETAKAVQGAMKQSDNPDVAGSAVGRLVKQAGVDTTMKNAIRDRAEWAWIPSGDTCSFCLTLASRGFQLASKKVLKGNHAEHIHANCDCTFFVRFDGKSTIEGYDPDALLKEYRAAEGRTSQDKINSLRRKMYAADPEKYLASKRAAYAREKIESGYKKSIITASLNSPAINNPEEIVNAFLDSIETPNDPVIIDKIKNCVRHMPIEDLDFIKNQGLIVKKTNGASSFLRSRRLRGSDGKLKYVIKINKELDEPYVFAHECAHLAEKVNKLYRDSDFLGVLENLAKNIKQFDVGIVDSKWYVTATSDLFIEQYQGRTYVLYTDFVNGRAIKVEDLVEYISVGYECYIGDSALLETKDPLLYNYFQRRGLR